MAIAPTATIANILWCQPIDRAYLSELICKIKPVRRVHGDQHTHGQGSSERNARAVGLGNDK